MVRAKTKGWFLLGVVFAKGCEFLLVSLGKGLGEGSGEWWGVVLLWKVRENGKGPKFSKFVFLVSFPRRNPGKGPKTPRSGKSAPP